MYSHTAAHGFVAILPTNKANDYKTVEIGLIYNYQLRCSDLAEQFRWVFKFSIKWKIVYILFLAFDL